MVIYSTAAGLLCISFRFHNNNNNDDNNSTSNNNQQQYYSIIMIRQTPNNHTTIKLLCQLKLNYTTIIPLWYHRSRSNNKYNILNNNRRRRRQQTTRFFILLFLSSKLRSNGNVHHSNDLIHQLPFINHFVIYDNNHFVP